MIDLHTHSSCSDGTHSPAELIREAVRKNLSAIALTDHDTLDGLDVAERTADETGIRFIRGVELSIECSRGELHLLGLNLSHSTEKLENRLVELRKERENRNFLIIEKMNADGISVTMEEIKKLSNGKVIGRPHFALYLINTGICRNMTEAFNKYLKRGQPYYKAKNKIALEEAVELIRESGGSPVVAHPLSLHTNWEEIEENFIKWKNLGIPGVETLHPSAGRSRTLRLEELAKKYGMFCTAGSDFHGSNRSKNKLGKTGWGKKIPKEYLSILEHFN